VGVKGPRRTVSLGALQTFRGKAGAGVFPRLSYSPSPDAWQNTRWHVEGRKYSGQVRGLSQGRWKRAEQLWAEEKQLSTLLATKVNSHVRLWGHLQTCQNTVHVRIHILILYTLLVDIKALPRFAT